MNVSEVLTDGFDRIKEQVHAALEGLSSEQLSVRLDADANSIAWLVWHLSRVQDDHVANIAGMPQVYDSGGWDSRFDLPFDRSDIGYGHDSDQVGKVSSDAATLLGYHDAVHDQTVKFIGSITESGLDRVVDENWNPPVTLGVRLVSVISDDLQHVGQAAFIRGIVERR